MTNPSQLEISNFITLITGIIHRILCFISLLELHKVIKLRISVDYCLLLK